MMSGGLEREQRLLSRFPKKRSELSPEYKAIFLDAYKNSREGQSGAATLALWLERWMHREVSRPEQGFPMLELGAGTLNHVEFEPAVGDYDVVEPIRELYENKAGRSRVRTIYPSIEAVPAGSRYRRIISVAVLEHVLDLPDLVARTALLLDDEGEFRSGIPSEGGLLWYLAWRYGTGLSFWLKYRLSYKTFQTHEHVNTADEIERVTRIFFEDVSIRRFPTAFRQVSFYTSITARRPRKDVAEAWLAKSRA